MKRISGSAKKALSVLLSLAVAFGVLSVGGIYASAEYHTGDLIKFGSYPQSRVTDQDIIDALEADSSEWVSYRYYFFGMSDTLGHSSPSDFMQYRDVCYDGKKYRGVNFYYYRPLSVRTFTSAKDTYQDENGYFTQTTYWFAYEPLIWRVLDPAAGLIMCEKNIDSQDFNHEIIYNRTDLEFYDITGEYFGNSYCCSSLRSWLNNDFYDLAFDQAQKDAIVLTTDLNNDCYMPSYTAYNSPACDDKIFILSYEDALNPEYGFDPSMRTFDAARRATGTDYAECQGLMVSRTPPYDGYSDWWLRSGRNNSSGLTVINFYGTDTEFTTQATLIGVRPVCRLSELKAEYSVDYPAEQRCTVTWNVLGAETVDEYISGDQFVKAADPVVEGKLFTGWTPDAFPETVTEDLVFTANFKDVKSDASTGVSVIFDADAFDEDEAELELFVDPIDKDEERFASYKTYTGGDDVYGLYEVCLKRGGVKGQPNGGRITVKIPVPAGLDLSLSFYVYHLKDDGSDEIISLRKGNLRVSEDARYLECEVASFSEFAICVHIEKIAFPVTFVRGSGETVRTTIAIPLSSCSLSQNGDEEIATACVNVNDELITAALKEAGIEDCKAVSDDGSIVFGAHKVNGEWEPEGAEIHVVTRSGEKLSFWKRLLQKIKAVIRFLFSLITGRAA